MADQARDYGASHLRRVATPSSDGGASTRPVSPGPAVAGGCAVAGAGEVEADDREHGSPRGVQWRAGTRSTAELFGLSGEVSDLANGLLQLAAVPANAEVVDAALSLVVALAHATVAGADGVSVMLSRNGTLATVAASDDTISGMDADQYATGQGPCVSAATEGQRICVDSLAEESRWPEFVPRAKKRGINSILSMPLLTAGRPLGALNIYSRLAGAFVDSDQSLAALCAQQASDLLANAAVDVSAEELNARLRDALHSRQTVTLAVGVIMARRGVSVDDAYTVLIQSSLCGAIALRDTARGIVASTQFGAAPDRTKDAGPNGRPD